MSNIQNKHKQTTKTEIDQKLEEANKAYLEALREKERIEFQDVNDALARLQKRLHEAEKPTKESQVYYKFLLFPHPHAGRSYLQGGCSWMQMQEYPEAWTYKRYKQNLDDYDPLVVDILNRKDVEPDETDQSILQKHRVTYRIVRVGPLMDQCRQHLTKTLESAEYLVKFLKDLISTYPTNNDMKHFQYIQQYKEQEYELFVKKRLREVEEDFDAYRLAKHAKTDDANKEQL